MNFRVIASVLTLGFALSGCAEKIPIDYSPSSTMTVNGTVKVGAFKYLPAITGKMKPNQIHNTAMGNVLLDKDVDTYFHNAVFTELRFVGIKVGAGDKTVSGEIKEFLIDDLGYSVDWTVDVHYMVSDPGGANSYDRDIMTKNHTSKFINPIGALNQQIKANIEELLKDADFVKAIN